MAQKFLQEDIDRFCAAASQGDLPRVRETLAAGIKPDSVGPAKKTALFYAARQGRTMVAEALLDAGANPNVVAPGSDDASQFRTALNIAAESMFFDMMDLLLDRGANPRIISEIRQTPVHILLSKCPDLLSRPDGARALDRLVDKMLRLGLPVNQAGADYMAPLHLAAQLGAPESTLALLLEHGGDVRVIDGIGRTPLHRASMAGNVKAIEFLANQGANVNEPDRQGQTPLFLAGTPEAAVALIKRRASVDTQDFRGCTVLSAALGRRRLGRIHDRVLATLLEAGADPLVSDQMGITPRELAEKTGAKEVIDLFAAHVARKEVSERMAFEREADVGLTKQVRERGYAVP